MTSSSFQSYNWRKPSVKWFCFILKYIINYCYRVGWENFGLRPFRTNSMPINSPKNICSFTLPKPAQFLKNLIYGYIYLIATHFRIPSLKARDCWQAQKERLMNKRDGRRKNLMEDNVLPQGFSTLKRKMKDQ